MPDQNVRILTIDAEKYLETTVSARDSVLSDLEKHAENYKIPILGPHVGSFLSIIARGCGAKNILEIGTASGYSGIWLARAAAANSGKLITIENDPKMRDIAEKSFKKAALSKFVKVVLADARDAVPMLANSRKAKFDLILMDVGEKKLYIELLDDCVRALKKGGIFIADDTLWHGSVVVPTESDPDTRTMRNFNKQLLKDKRLESVIIPIGDGLTIALKK